MTSLARLALLFGSRAEVRIRSSAGLAGVLYPVVEVVMRSLATVFYLAHLGVLAILLRDGQRREYLADQRAAELAGTEALAQVLDIALSNVDSVIASRARAGEDNEGWRVAVNGVLRGENGPYRRRLRQLSTRQDASLWHSHPPSGLRAWLVEAEPWREPTLVLSQDESDRIDAELARYYQRARRDLAQSGV
jgi:Zn-dependent protease with chaperone function